MLSLFLLPRVIQKKYGDRKAFDKTGEILRTDE